MMPLSNDAFIKNDLWALKCLDSADGQMAYSKRVLRMSMSQRKMLK